MSSQIANNDNTLSPTEKTERNTLEKIIFQEQGLDDFVKRGEALRILRDKRLYRETHSRFDEYCIDKCHMSRRNADRLITAANIVEELSSDERMRPIGLILPEKESQARPLAKLETAEQRQEAWEQAVEHSVSGKPSALEVEASVAAIKNASTSGGSADLQQVAYASASLEMRGPSAETERIETLEEKKHRLGALMSSDSPEHYTPREILDLVVDCFGFIELDPCSNCKIEPNVPALRHYVKEDNGLAHPWRAKTLFLNPPYGYEIKKWIVKLINEFESGNLQEGIALLPARTDTQWFDALSDFPFCLVVGRITFVGSENNAPFPSVIFYLGKNVRKFYSIFSTIGAIFHKMQLTDIIE